MAFLSSFYPQPVVPNAIEVTASGSDTARTLSDRFGEVFHVDDFGAVGDGITDDTDAIQLAINAAILAGIATVKFSTKTYIINRNNLSSGGHPSIGVGLTIVGGTTSTQLRFDGNGAILKSTLSIPSRGHNIFYVWSQWHTLVFDGLSFVYEVPLHTVGGAPQTGIRVASKDNNYHERMDVLNCRFIDCTAAIICESYKRSERWRRFRKFVCENTEFLFLKGTGRSDGNFQTVTVMLSQWIEHATFNNIRYDGLVGSRLLSGQSYAKDGFLFPAAKHTQVSNSFFTNASFEVFKNQVDDEAVAYPMNFSSFTQPPVGNTVTVTITVNSVLGGESDVLRVGDIYSVWANLRWNIGTCGVYRLEATTSNNYEVGTELTLRRLDSSRWVRNTDWEVATGQIVGGGDGNFLRFFDLQQLDSSSHFSNNVFYLPSIVDSSGNYSTSANSNTTAILVGGNSLISNNTFIGGRFQIVCEGTYRNTLNDRPIIISNNHFFLRSESSSSSDTSYNATAVATEYGKTIIQSNYMQAEQSRDCVYFIFWGANGGIVINNVAEVLEPEITTTNNQTRFINFRISDPPNGDDVLIENNVLRGVHHYANQQGATVQRLGQFYGQLLGTIAPPTSGALEIVSTWTSKTGNQFDVSIDDDGTLVTKEL